MGLYRHHEMEGSRHDFQERQLLPEVHILDRLDIGQFLQLQPPGWGLGPVTVPSTGRSPVHRSPETNHESEPHENQDAAIPDYSLQSLLLYAGLLGYRALPIMLTANQLLIVVILAFGGWGAWEHARFLSVKAEYSDFREQAVTQALAQEKQHNEQISVAMAERDASIARMRDNEIRFNSSFLPKTTGNSETACYDRSRLDAALSKFEEGIRELLTEGDEAIINNRAWASAWPE